MDENIAISVRDVSMHFNMASERVETLKEYFVKAFKRELFFNDFVAVDSVSFDIKKGEVFGIVGTNGSGKSTMLKMISGIMEPTKGEIETRGTIAPLIELGAGFDGELTARENIFLNGAILGYEKGFIEEKFNSIVDFAELWDFLDMPIKNYSSGMVARIAFSIATVVKPDILIVDEILSVGDFMFQKKCEQRIKDLMAEGTTVVIVSHSMDQIESLCDRVLWLEKSKAKMVGKTFDVCNAYRNLQNEKTVLEQKKYQVVASEKCFICGEASEFRDELGMTYKSEAFCSHCGAPIRVSDMMKFYMQKEVGVDKYSTSERREYFADKKILATGNKGALATLLAQYEGFDYLKGDFASRCKMLSNLDEIQDIEYNYDLIILEDLLGCVENPLDTIKELVKHLTESGSLLITVQLYEGEKTELNKKAGYYWNGAPVVNKWGDDAVGVIEDIGLKAELFQGHKWYKKEEIIKYGGQKEKRNETHPFYFFKFNTCAIIVKK